MPQEQPSSSAAPATGGKAVKRSIPRVIIFSVLSGSLYAFYWFYQTRKAVTQEVGGNDSVGLQTLGLIVPILNFFITYWLFRDLEKARQGAGITGGFSAQTYIYALVGLVVLGFFPIIGLFTWIAVVILYIMVLVKLNELWERKGYAEAPYTGGEIAVVAVGFLLGVGYFVLLASLLAELGGADGAEQLDQLEQFNQYDPAQ